MKKFSIALMGMLLFLSACNNAESELNDFYDDFSKSLSEESDLADVNEQYNELEKEKADLQNELNEANLEEINDLSPQLIENTEERQSLLDEEAEMVNKAKETFEDTKETAEDISDESYKNEADSLIAAMDARFAAHEALNQTYTDALESETALFEYLGEDEVTQEVIDEHLNEIASFSEPMSQASQDFSKETEKVNQIKAEIESILEEN